MATLQAGEQCRHGRKLSALKPCRECAANPGPPITVQQHSADDPALSEHERWLLGRRDVLDAIASDVKESAGTRVKAAEASLKYERSFLELYNKRKDREYGEALMAHEKLMAGLGMRGAS